MQAERIILDMKYARIIEIISQYLGITIEEAMDIFYKSPIFELIDKGVADLHCRSDQYLAEIIIEEGNHAAQTGKIGG
ncbi:DUF3791 domain-containing protein [uncultured Prevotella sp.]|uniref:DUF3791 domain-containing protein n=1 Tax=uncultured Prevotella sp. TaxID=159272 RepID=UPI0027E32063|nr:DUF3791 domain-containing protein [uncultured Prevotella sp.]